MRIRDENGVYHVLESLLRKAGKPLTCVDLHDNPDVRKFSDSVSRTSDYLGHMYRRGVIARAPAPKSLNSQARFAYFLKDKKSAKPEDTPMTHAEVINAVVKATDSVQAEVRPAASRSLLSKPNIEVTDNGGTVVIDLPQLTITIRTK